MVKKMLRKQIEKYRKYKHRKIVYNAINNGLRLGKNVTIMDEVRFDPPHNSLISIGDNTTIGPEVAFIAHDATTFKPLNYGRIGFIRIGSDCFIGERSIILPGVEIGSNCIVGAGSVVSKDIPAGSIAVGNPCQVVGSYDNFLNRHSKKIEDGIVIEYSELYGNIVNTVKELKKNNPNLRIFYSKGQSGKRLQSHFRFNVTKNE